MQYKVIPILILLCSCFVLCEAQDSTTVSRKTKISKYDTTYIERYPRRLYVNVPLSSRYMGFEVYDKLTKKTIEYRPNRSSSIGANFSYRWISLGFSTQLPALKSDEERHGKTSKFDFVTVFSGRKNLLDFNLSTYKGFYVKNPGELTTWDSDVFPKREDIEATFIGFGFTHFFNCRKYSYRATFSQTEKQKKSAGSLLLGGNWSIFLMDADTSIILSEFRSSFGNYAYLRAAAASNFGITAGYIYTWILKRNFYITALLNPGLGLQGFTAENESGDRTTSSSKLAFRLQARLAVGYRSDTWYYGFSGMKDNYFLSSSGDASMNYNLGMIRLFVGRRFDIEKRKK